MASRNAVNSTKSNIKKFHKIQLKKTPKEHKRITQPKKKTASQHQLIGTQREMCPQNEKKTVDETLLKS